MKRLKVSKCHAATECLDSNLHYLYLDYEFYYIKLSSFSLQYHCTTKHKVTRMTEMITKDEMF